MLTKEESIPARSKWGLAARDVFLEQFNDVNFYVEDEKQENFYLEVFRTLFPKIAIAQIFGLGGKRRCARAFKGPSQRSAPAAVSVYLG
jgi:hypothetical protein